MPTVLSGIWACSAAIGGDVPAKRAGSKPPSKSVIAGFVSRGPFGRYGFSSGNEASGGKSNTMLTSFAKDAWSPGSETIAPDLAYGEIKKKRNAWTIAAWASIRTGLERRRRHVVVVSF